MLKRTTIQDVAKLAGVGKVTVSYVLNGRSKETRISEETEKKVLQAAEVLRYRPNALARMLATQQTHSLAVVFQSGNYFSTWSNFTSEVMRGVCAAAVNQGFDLMLHTKHVGSAEMEADTLSDGRVDGALVLRDQDDPTVKALISRNFPTVQFFTRSDDKNTAWVDADNYNGGRIVARHFLELGHRRFGMVMGGPGSVSANDRFSGFRDALGAAGHALPAEHCLRGSNLGNNPKALLEMVSRPAGPTALFVWSDDDAYLVLEVLRNHGIRVPEDVSVIGFDSLAPSQRTVPPLTSIRQPVHEMAFNATRLLVNLIRKESPAKRQFLFPLSLDVRGSTASRPDLDHEEVHP